MAEPSERSLDATLPTGGARAAADANARAYLLVFESGSSWLFSLDRGFEATIGRGETASLRLADPAVSRHHARIVASEGEFSVVDLESHNGTRVNGERIAGARPLRAGDVINIGGVTLVFHRSPSPPSRKPLLSLAQLRQRLEEELERSRRYQRPTAVLALDVGNQGDRSVVGGRLSAELRLLDAAAWASDEQLLVLLPEVRAESAPTVAERVVRLLSPHAPGIRAGFACCPTDGVDADALVAAARAALRTANPGGAAGAGEAATTLRVGDRSVVVCAPAMVRLFALIEKLSASDLPVLIAGETGAGKEIAAAALHHWSPRKEKRLLAINCAALPETLLESELFGYEKGAFSGAQAAKPGLFESAEGGTVFLDEVGELSLSAQAKLLRVLETKRVSRLGALDEREVSVRLVAATNRSLDGEVKKGRFRQDLFFRLSAASLILPPLRDRPQEIPILARAFLSSACQALGRPPMEFSPEAMQALASHRWPGNVRELKNAMDYVAAATRDPEVQVEHLPSAVVENSASEPASAGAARGEHGAAGEVRPTDSAVPVLASPRPTDPPPPEPGSGIDALPSGYRNIYDEIRELERRRMVAALKAANGVQVRAAELIGMPLRTFATKLKQYGLVVPKR